VIIDGGDDVKYDGRCKRYAVTTGNYKKKIKTLSRYNAISVQEFENCKRKYVRVVDVKKLNISS